MVRWCWVKLPVSGRPAGLDKCRARVSWLYWVQRPFVAVFQPISGRLPNRGIVGWLVVLGLTAL